MASFVKFVFGLIGLMFLIGVFSGGKSDPIGIVSAANNAVGTGCKVSLERYNSLGNGMSYLATVRVLGCEGSQISTSTFGGFTTAMYAWDGAGSLGANMNATFQNGSLVSKAQFGLR